MNREWNYRFHYIKKENRNTKFKVDLLIANILRRISEEVIGEDANCFNYDSAVDPDSDQF